MKKLSLLSVAFAGALLLTGCSSISSMEHRAARYPQTWAKLTPADKERVVHGDFKPGDSMKLVYIRYGTPDAVRRSFNAAGQALDVWVWRLPEPADAVPSSSRTASSDYGVMGEEKPANTPEQIKTESATAAREWRQAIAPPTPGANSWSGERRPPGPFPFAQGVLASSTEGYRLVETHAKLQLPEQERL